jgi:predicted RNA-binding Zn-ribbon protein involved in translation (DUF1610 family)
MMESVDKLAVLIERCQKSTIRKPETCYKCKGVALMPVILQGKERYILFECPTCKECRALEWKELVMFRLLGQLVVDLSINLQGEGNNEQQTET